MDETPILLLPTHLLLSLGKTQAYYFGLVCGFNSTRLRGPPEGGLYTVCALIWDCTRPQHLLDVHIFFEVMGHDLLPCATLFPTWAVNTAFLSLPTGIRSAEQTRNWHVVRELC